MCAKQPAVPETGSSLKSCKSHGKMPPRHSWNGSVKSRITACTHPRGTNDRQAADALKPETEFGPRMLRLAWLGSSGLGKWRHTRPRPNMHDVAAPQTGVFLVRVSSSQAERECLQDMVPPHTTPRLVQAQTPTLRSARSAYLICEVTDPRFIMCRVLCWTLRDVSVSRLRRTSCVMSQLQ